tara:strand:+ start:2649 stop:2996 length:348 start_codon:yes stop_codon:yes gene_type:complete
MAHCLIISRFLYGLFIGNRSKRYPGSGLWHHAPSGFHPMAAMKPEDLERLVTQTMPYGKYKGRLIADLPGHYLNWFARVGFPPGDLGRLLALMQEIDHNGLSPLLEPLRRNLDRR